MRMKIVAYSNAELQALSGPQQAGEPQTIPWILFDSQSYVSGTTTQLNFYQAVQADPTLGNVPQPASLDTPKYFAIESAGVDILLLPAAQAGHAATGPINDVAQLLFSGRGILTFTYQNKAYGPWPLSAFQASGGPTGFGWATMTAEAQVSYANNGIPTGEGWGMNQQIILRPNAAFKWALQVAAALTLAAGNTNLRHWMYGAQYQAVV
jgi:hypothetical protein